jgi:hypothetical protein
MTMTKLPPSIKKRIAAGVRDRENAVIDNFEYVREIQAACLSNPSAYDIVNSARDLGFQERLLIDDDDGGRVWAIVEPNKDEIVAILLSMDGINTLWPGEGRW